MSPLNRRLSRLATSAEGETLVETLIAMVVAAFSMLMLAGAIRSSTMAVTRTRAVAHEYYDTTKVLVEQSGTNLGDVGITIGYSNGGGSPSLMTTYPGLSDSVSVNWTGTISNTNFFPNRTPVATFSAN